MSEKRCVSCKWCELDVTNVGQGKCHLNPPITVSTAGAGGQLGFMSYAALVSVNRDYCSFHAEGIVLASSLHEHGSVTP